MMLFCIKSKQTILQFEKVTWDIKLTVLVSRQVYTLEPLHLLPSFLPSSPNTVNKSPPHVSIDKASSRRVAAVWYEN